MITQCDDLHAVLFIPSAITETKQRRSTADQLEMFP